MFHKKLPPPLPPVHSVLPAPPAPPAPSSFPSSNTEMMDEEMDDMEDDLMLPVEGRRGRPVLTIPPKQPPRLKPPLPPEEKLSDDFQPGVGGRYPPIFIKIDRYRELIEEIERLKLSAVSLRDAVDALSEMSKELSSGITITQRALDKFNIVVSGIDAKMLKTGSPSVGEHPISAGEIDAYVKGLYSQMENLKKDLKTV